jgi:formate hydrogenlyase subunit 4
LELSEGSKLFETYHGILVNVRYMLSAEIPRGVFSKPLKKSLELVVVVEVLNFFMFFFDVLSESRKSDGTIRI